MGSLLLKGTTYAAAAPDGICARVPAFVECKSRDRATTADLYPSTTCSCSSRWRARTTQTRSASLCRWPSTCSTCQRLRVATTPRCARACSPSSRSASCASDPYLYHTILHTCETIGPMLRDASAQHGGRPPIPSSATLRVAPARPDPVARPSCPRRSTFVRRTPTANGRASYGVSEQSPVPASTHPAVVGR